MIINTSFGNGLFVANPITLTEITEADIQANIMGAYEPVTMLLDLSAVSGGEYMVKPEKANIFIPLESGVMNYIQITSHGIIDADGYAKFKISEKNGSTVTGKGIKVGFIKFRKVINH